jgi:uncharacterized protein (DUF1697 family)
MTTEYIAFLRGINVGGRRSVKMSELEAVFLSLGFQNVRTVLASGNLIFEGPKNDPEALADEIRKKLEARLGLKTDLILRPLAGIRKLVKANPFKAFAVTPETRFYVTFLPEKSRSALAYRYESPEKDVRIFGLSRGEVGAVLTLSPRRGTPELMGTLDKQFGRNVTTRNWTTVQKIAERSISRPEEK